MPTPNFDKFSKLVHHELFKKFLYEFSKKKEDAEVKKL